MKYYNNDGHRKVSASASDDKIKKYKLNIV